jgi:hypothetical protein
VRIRRFFSEPILHFLLIGLALFAAHRFISPDDSAGRRIVITQGVVDDLVTQHVAVRGREPTARELNHLIESYVRDEILYREGVALGLDRDDIVVKRRVRQKIEVMAEEDASRGAPTDTELTSYLAANADRFRQPAIMTFEQVFLGPPASGPVVERTAATIRDAVRRGSDPVALGRPTLLPSAMKQTGSDLIARSYGANFAEALEDAPVGEWTGPIESEYGAHYVRVSSRIPAEMARLSEVRDQVVREWENQRRRRARDDSYAKMRDGYVVNIEATLSPKRP